MVLVECARIYVRKCDSKITEFYRKLKRKGKHENVAIISCKKIIAKYIICLRKESHFIAKKAFL